MTTLPISVELTDFAKVFRRAGKKAFLVGGAIRDMLLDQPLQDFDVATDARPEEVLRLFKRVIPTGIKHGTVTVMWRGLAIETTTFRSETGYSDGRHPDSVVFGDSIHQDLSRRDFTINAMALDLESGELLDPYAGKDDLAACIIRTVGRALERFSEDGLRPLRAVRFASKLGFSVEPDTLAAIPQSMGKFRMVSIERVREELEKILLSSRPSVGFLLLETTGLLEEIVPELACCRGVLQKGLHAFDVLDHSLLACDAIEPVLQLRLAAVLHDIGKPSTKKLGPDGVATFHRHEGESSVMVERILTRLKFPNETIGDVVHLVGQHMFQYEESWSDSAVRRFIVRIGKEYVERLFAIRLADAYAHRGVRPDPRTLEPFRKRIEKTLAAEEALSIKAMAVSGDDLASIGVPRSPVMGAILKELFDSILDDPTLNEKGRLMDIALKLKEKHGVRPGA
ncbi:MAG: HD domain-containing protein [Spirochaetes bacterium]|nr:HD domain-containing protein [Spirochaetota bacterium]